MLRKRLIFTLLFSEKNFYISRNFNLQKVGDINWLYSNYNFDNISRFIDELIIIDVSREKRDIDRLCDCVKVLSKKCFLPLSVGGGINNIEKAKKLFKSGADKIVINTGLFYNKEFLNKLSKYAGSQSIVGSADFKSEKNKIVFYTHNGTNFLRISLKDFFKKINKFPIGEILLRSINNDGTGQGLELEFLKKIDKNFTKKIILSGGIGNKDHLLHGYSQKKVDAIATSNLFNFIGDGLFNTRNFLIKKKINLALHEKY